MGLQPAAKAVKTTQMATRAVKVGSAFMKVVQAVKVTPGSKSSRSLLTNTSNSQRLSSTETANVMKDVKFANLMDAISTAELRPLMCMECRHCGWRQAVQLQ